MVMKMKRRGIIGALLLVFAAGLFLILYPKISGAVTDRRTDDRTQSVTEWIHREREQGKAEQPDESTAESKPIYNEPTVPRHHADLWEAAHAYNKRIWEDKQAGLSDPWAYEQPSFELGDFGLEYDAFAVIRIPAIGLEMPVYLGATDEHLTLGAAHIGGTSLPVGGVNTNCVIAGHRGWKGGTFFRHLEDLKPGNTVYIDNLWETLTYTVQGSEIINPNQISKLLIRPEQDILTLFTCTRNGKQRLVVYCVRER